MIHSLTQRWPGPPGLQVAAHLAADAGRRAQRRQQPHHRRLARRIGSAPRHRRGSATIPGSARRRCRFRGRRSRAGRRWRSWKNAPFSLPLRRVAVHSFGDACVSLRSSRVLRTMSPRASSPYRSAWSQNSPSAENVLPPPRRAAIDDDVGGALEEGHLWPGLGQEADPDAASPMAVRPLCSARPVLAGWVICFRASNLGDPSSTEYSTFSSGLSDGIGIRLTSMAALSTSRPAAWPSPWWR